MAQSFIFPQRDQPLLMPVDMREWLPEDDLVFIVLDAVAALDLGEFRRRYRADGHGRAAFDPEMMVALLLSACRTKHLWRAGSWTLEGDGGWESRFGRSKVLAAGDRALTVIPGRGAGAVSADCARRRRAAIRFRTRPGRAGTSWSVSGRS